MKRLIISLHLALIVLVFPQFAASQQKSNWPKILQLNGNRTAIYHPKVESFNNNILTAHADVSVRQEGVADPVFGTIWFTGIMSASQDKKMLSLETLDITDVRIPDLTDTVKIIKWKGMLERDLPASGVVFSRDSVVSEISLSNREMSGRNGLSTSPPKIIYSERPAILVVIDGDPKLEKIENTSLQRVVNTPCVILYTGNEGKYYLNAGNYWFSSRQIAGAWLNTDKLPSEVAEIDRQIKEESSKNKNGGEVLDFPSAPEVIISTEPAELIQTSGVADLQPVEGTTLWYAANSNDNIFKDPQGGFYYILLTGRWYAGKSLEGPWNFVPSDQLPKEFSNIPEGWERDNVRSSVAGTTESRDAVRNAEVPQTARVDRKTANASVEYDGDAEFQPVEGVQNTYYASNTSSSVLRIGNVYYCVDNGIWYVANGPYGPWQVATDRPGEVEQIPASCPVYNVKYVYIYDVTPEYVYVGYTPGYTGCYVYGQTVIYGTGIYYNSWYSRIYYPRPFTWGFSMTYDPWYGWCFGSNNYWLGYYQGYYDGMHHHHHHGGWWGPSRYNPPAYHAHHEFSGHRHNENINHQNERTSVKSGSLYNGRKDVVNIGKNSSYTNTGFKKVLPGSQPNINPGSTGNGKILPGGHPTVKPGSNDNSRISPSGKPQNNTGGTNDGKTLPGGQPNVKPGINDNSRISPSGKPVNNNGGTNDGKTLPGGQPNVKPGINDNNRISPSGKPQNNTGGTNDGKTLPGGQPNVKPGIKDNNRISPSGKPQNNTGGTNDGKTLPGGQPNVKPGINDNNRISPSGKPQNNTGGNYNEKNREVNKENNNHKPSPQPSTKPNSQPQQKQSQGHSTQPSGKPGVQPAPKTSVKPSPVRKEEPGKKIGK